LDIRLAAGVKEKGKRVVFYLLEEDRKKAQHGQKEPF